MSVRFSSIALLTLALSWTVLAQQSSLLPQILPRFWQLGGTATVPPLSPSPASIADPPSGAGSSGRRQIPARQTSVPLQVAFG